MGLEPGGFTDLHCHLVPGVDDGSKNLEDARLGLRKMVQAGIQTIVSTPHFDGSLTRDKSMLAERLEELDHGWAALNELVRSEFPGLILRQGHEVMLDIPDPDLSDPRLSLADTSYMLVEWPGLRVPPQHLPVLERLAEAGIRPIIAHPERYRGLDSGGYMAGEWKERGALLQVNYGSVTGRYGRTPQKWAFTFLERGWVDLMATDFHGRAHLTPYLTEARQAFANWGGGAQFGLLARENPARILNGEEPLPVHPFSMKAGVWDRIRLVFNSRGGG
jgi:protein-tyrosine phosphatase